MFDIFFPLLEIPNSTKWSTNLSTIPKNNQHFMATEIKQLDFTSCLFYFILFSIVSESSRLNNSFRPDATFYINSDLCSRYPNCYQQQSYDWRLLPPPTPRQMFNINTKWTPIRMQKTIAKTNIFLWGMDAIYYLFFFASQKGRGYQMS